MLLPAASFRRIARTARAGGVALMLVIAGFTLHAAEFHVATDGSDAIRGGTYRMTDAHIMRRERVYAYVTLLDKNGEWRSAERAVPASYADERLTGAWTLAGSPMSAARRISARLNFSRNRLWCR